MQENIGAHRGLAANWGFARASMIFAIKGRWEGVGGGGGQQDTVVTERRSLRGSWGCLRRSQGGILTLKASVGITHTHDISLGALPSCLCAAKAGTGCSHVWDGDSDPAQCQG